MKILLWEWYAELRLLGPDFYESGHWLRYGGTAKQIVTFRVIHNCTRWRGISLLCNLNWIWIETVLVSVPEAISYLLFHLNSLLNLKYSFRIITIWKVKYWNFYTLSPLSYLCCLLLPAANIVYFISFCILHLYFLNPESSSCWAVIYKCTKRMKLYWTVHDDSK